MDDQSKAGEKIPPALTPEEWHEVEGESYLARVGHGLEFGIAKRPHALAALVLYEQPFGFTTDDLETLTIATLAARYEGKGNPYLEQTLNGLYRRIYALLPPPSEEDRENLLQEWEMAQWRWSEWLASLNRT
jgi:hypothetical protein